MHIVTNLNTTLFFWIDAETEESTIASFAKILGELHLMRQQDLSDPMKPVYDWLSTHDGWLVILDNLAESALVRSFLLAPRQGDLLFIYRKQFPEELFSCLEVPPLSDQEGMFFILYRAHLFKKNQPFEQLPTEITRSVREIVHEMGGLPLALDQAASYIYECKCHPASFLDAFRANPITTLSFCHKNKDYSANAIDKFLAAFNNTQFVKQKGE
jgi:hypothetical protein